MTQYCDDCAKVLKFSETIAITELPFNIDSANEGESGIICFDCLKNHGFDICPQCNNLVDVGDGNTIDCESCDAFYHPSCRSQYHIHDMLVCFNCFDEAKPPKGGTKPGGK